MNQQNCATDRGNARRSSAERGGLFESRLSRRSFMVGLAASAAAPLVVAACGPLGGQQPAGAGKAEPQVKMTFYYPNWGQPAIYETKEQRKIEAFHRQAPRYRIEAVPVTGAYAPQLTALFAGGSPPETFWADHQVVLSYAKQGFLEDLQPFAQKDRAFKKDDLHPQALSDLTAENRLWGLTGWAFTNLYYYNADLFKQAGLPLPYDLWKQDRWTWDAYLDAVVKLIKREGGKTIQVGTTLGLARLWINAAGGQEFDNVKMPRRCLYDTEAAMGGLQFRYDLQYKHRVHDPDFYRETGLNETTAFINGKSATMSRWTTGLHDFKTISFKWGMVPYPKKQRYASDYTHWAYVLAKGLKDEKVRAAGWEWLKFLTGPEGQKLEAEDMVAIPFTKAAQEVFTKSLRQLATLERPEVMGEILNKYAFSRLIAVDTPEIGKIMNEELGPFWSGERGVRPAAAAVAQRVNEYLRSNPQRLD